MEVPVVIRRNRASSAELRQRVELAARLLADGCPQTAAVSQMAERFGVDRRTARRYVAEGRELLAAEIGPVDLAQTMGEAIERLRRLAWLAESAGNLNAAVGAERAAISALVAIHRSDAIAAARLHDHTYAMAGPDPPTEMERRRYRQSIHEIEPPF